MPRTLAWIGCFAVLALSAAIPAWSQADPVPVIPDPVLPVSVGSHGNEQSHLDDVQYCIEQADWPGAVRCVEIAQEQFDKAADNAVVATGDGSFGSPRHALHRLAMRIPDAALEDYRKRHAREMEVEFESAMTRRDPPALRAFARDFVLFPQSIDALRILADLAMERGDFAEAAWQYSQIVDLLGPSAREPLGLLGQSLLQMGEGESFTAWCESRGIDPRTPLRVSGVETTVGDWLAASRAAESEQAAPATVKFLTTNGAVTGEFPLPPDSAPGALLWEVPLSESVLTPRVRQEAEARGLAVPLPFFPLADADRVYLVSATRILAVDRRTGGVAWTHEKNMDPARLPKNALNLMYGGALDAGLLFAFLDREILCLRAATGEVAWRRDFREYRASSNVNEVRPDDTIARGKTFSAPVAANGALYFTFADFTAGDTQTYAAALDAATGETRWLTFLSAAFTGDFLGLGNPASAPSICGNMLYAAPHMGSVACLAADTGEVRWLRTYAPNGVDMRNRKWLRGTRWRQWAQPLVCGGQVLILPCDSDALLAFDRVTGAPRWSHPRGGASWLAGIQQGAAVIAGDDIRWLELNTGRLLRRLALPEPAAAFPAIRENSVLLPTATGILQAQATGAGVREYWPESWTPGNLRALDGMLLAIDVDALRCYGDSEIDLARLTAAGDDDPDTRAALARLAFCAGRFDEAITGMRALSSPDAWPPEHAAEADRMRESWADMLLRAAAADLRSGRPEAVIARMPDAVAKLTQSPRYPELVVSLARAHEARDEWTEAVDAYQRLLAPRLDKSCRIAGMELSSRDLAKARIAELLRVYGRQHYARAEARAEELLARGDRLALQELLDCHPFSARVEDAVIALANLQGAEGPRGQETALATLEEVVMEEGEGSLPASVELSRRYLEAGRYGAARQLAMETVRRFPMRPVSWQGESLDAHDWMERVMAAMPPDATRPLLPGLDLAWSRPIVVGADTREIITPPGNDSDLFCILYDELLECRDIRNGRRLWSRPYGVEYPAIAMDGDLLLMVHAGQVTAINLRNGRERWTATQERLAGDSSTFGGLYSAVIHGEMCVVLGETGACGLDSTTGQVLWRFFGDNESPRQCLFFGDEPILVTQTPAKAIVLDVATGAERRRLELAPRGERLTRNVILAGDWLVAQTQNLDDGGDVLRTVDCRGGRAGAHVAFEHAVTDVIAAGGRAAVVQEAGFLFVEIQCVELTTGEIAWAEEISGRNPSRVVHANEALFLCYEDAETNTVMLAAHAWDDGHRLWTRETGAFGEPASVLTAEGCDLVCERGTLNVDVYDWRQRQLSDRFTVVSDAGEGEAHLIHGRLLVINERNLYGFCEGSAAAAMTRAAQRRLSGRERASWELRECRAHAMDLFRARRYEECAAFCAAVAAERPLDAEDFQDFFELKEGAREAGAELRRPVLYVPRMSTPPAIDGSLNDEYAEHFSMTLQGLAPVETVQAGAPDLIGVTLPAAFGKTKWLPGWNGEDDLSAKMYMGWGEDLLDVPREGGGMNQVRTKLLFVAIDVPDRVVTLYDREAVNWVGDCMWFAFDTMDLGGYAYHEGIYNLLLGYMKPRKDKEQEKRDLENRPQGKFQVRRKADNSGSIYEFAIPWDDLRLRGAPDEPAAGVTLGFDVVIADDDHAYDYERMELPYTDDQHATKALNWTPGMSIYKRMAMAGRYGIAPKLFGRLQLTD